MNNDRFLTRVWDKQEKKMIYKHQEFTYDGMVYTFESVTNNIIIASERNHLITIEYHHEYWSDTEDRFTPMRCTGKKDKSNKLMYADDVILYEHENYKGIITDLGDVFRVREKNFYKDFPVLGCQQLIGNRWEQPELLEVKA